jgi:hypothetical protein
MTTKTDPATTQESRGGFRRGADVAYGYLMALAAWQSRGTVVATLVLALLVVVAQSGLAAAGESNKWIGGLHALDGMVILLLSLWLAISARRRR